MPIYVYKLCPMGEASDSTMQKHEIATPGHGLTAAPPEDPIANKHNEQENPTLPKSPKTAHLNDTKTRMFITAANNTENIVSVAIDISTESSEGPHPQSARELHRLATEATRSELPKNTVHEFGAAYQKRSFIAFFCILFFLCMFEGIFLYKNYRITNVAPVVRVLEAGVVLANAKQALTENQNKSFPALFEKINTLRSAAVHFNKEVAIAKAEGDAVCRNELIAWTFHFCLLAGGCGLAFRYRMHKVVKSRGIPYLIQVFLSIVCWYISVAVLDAFFNIYPFEFPDAMDISKEAELMATGKRMLDMTYGFEIVGFYSFFLFIKSFIQRQRIMYYLFNKPLQLDGHKINPLKRLPITMLLLSPIVLSYSIWRFYYDAANNLVPVSLIAPFVLLWLFSGWFFFYSYKTRKAHMQFSDYYFNLRIIVFNCLIWQFHILWVTFHTNDLLRSIGWSVYGRICTSLCLLDLCACQLIQLRSNVTKTWVTHTFSFRTFSSYTT
eukprot:comp7334_c0_seq1/m.3035 comp7334_c0_seq1/g.3035  ORF comp7334_c0_seq1/g.3035 comp7334_c0_seq1/m.3035 type:complete len:497 (-) comp7334_c0_seq1:408-1898(-)